MCQKQLLPNSEIHSENGWSQSLNPQPPHSRGRRPPTPQGWSKTAEFTVHSVFSTNILIYVAWNIMINPTLYQLWSPTTCVTAPPALGGAGLQLNARQPHTGPSRWIGLYKASQNPKWVFATMEGIFLFHPHPPGWHQRSLLDPPFLSNRNSA